MRRFDRGAPATPGWSGPWNDPVHEAEVAARLAALQARLASAAEVDGSVGVPAVARRGLIPRLRVRVGHLLVEFGGFVEGQGDGPDSTVARTA